MTEAEQYYHEIAGTLQSVTKGKMFGALCLKAPNGKAFAMFWKDYMIFKLDEDALQHALHIKGAVMFDPMGGRPMNGWAQIPFIQKKEWARLAKEAHEFVKTIKTK